MIGKTSWPTLGIFPEGTTTNNKCLLKFKKGAFMTLTPVKVIVIKYSTDGFFPTIDNISGLGTLVMICCNTFIKATVFEFEGLYNPDYLNLDPKDENSWKVYAEKVRDIMSKASGIPKQDFGWKEIYSF